VTSEAKPITGSRVTPAMHIGEVAARTELSLRSLRHWDEVGLLRPSGRTDGGFRLYTEADVEKILLIRRMKPLGFTLDQMSAAMRDIETLHQSGLDQAGAGQAQERLTQILREATERRQKLVRQLAMADEFIDLLSRRLPERCSTSNA
jgi:MerR family transcriptional regulator, copper efflux regulator